MPIHNFHFQCFRCILQHFFPERFRYLGVVSHSTSPSRSSKRKKMILRPALIRTAITQWAVRNQVPEQNKTGTDKAVPHTSIILIRRDAEIPPIKKVLIQILETLVFCCSILRSSIQHSLASCCWNPPCSPLSANLLTTINH
jgi:hypothetical protein